MILQQYTDAVEDGVAVTLPIQTITTNLEVILTSSNPNIPPRIANLNVMACIKTQGKVAIVFNLFLHNIPARPHPL